MLIKADALSYSVQQQTILRNISLAISAGDYLAIVGPNGSGKSSLLKLLNGLIKPTTGEININHTSLHSLSRKALARLISYVPQSSGKNLQFVVEDFIKMARYPYHNALSDWQTADREAVEQALHITNTEAFRHRQMDTLSGGEAQRVMIAAALCQQTPVILLDEPTSYLDPHHQVEVHQLIKRLNQQHDIAIIEVTHDINHAAHHADQVLALKQGEKLWSGDSKQFLNAERLYALYDQHFVFLQHPQTAVDIALPEQ